MALTQLKTGAIADDAVTTDKLANAINTERTANTAKTTNATHTGDVTGSGSLTIADNAVTLAKMAGGTDGQIITYDASGDPVAVGPGTDGQVLTSTGAGSPPAFEAIPASGKAHNLIINGAFQVAQRGTSSTSDGIQTVDRFALEVSGADENPTQAQADVASGTTPYTLGFRKSFKITNGNQTSGAAADDRIGISYNMEAQDVANSGWNYKSTSSYITFSFWVKSSVAQNFYGYFYTADSPNYLYSFETGSLTADTWTKVTKTISGNSNLVFNNDNGKGFEIAIAPFWGTDFTDSGHTLNTWAAYASSSRAPDYASTWYTTNNATFEITGVQLEVGSVASTDFEHRSYAQELALCQRYYIFNGASMGNCGKSYSMSSFDMVMSVNYGFPVQMRATPSVTTTNVILKNDDDGNETANINSLSKYGHQYGIKKLGGSSEEYAIQISDFKYSAEL